MSKEHLPADVIAIFEDHIGLPIFAHDRKWRKAEAIRLYGGWNPKAWFQLPKQVQMPWLVRAALLENYPVPITSAKAGQHWAIKGVINDNNSMNRYMRRLVADGVISKPYRGRYSIDHIDHMEIAIAIAVYRQLFRVTAPPPSMPDIPLPPKPQPGTSLCPYCERPVSILTGLASANPVHRGALAHHQCIYANELSSGGLQLDPQVAERLSGKE